MVVNNRIQLEYYKTLYHAHSAIHLPMSKQMNLIFLPVVVQQRLARSLAKPSLLRSSESFALLPARF